MVWIQCRFLLLQFTTSFDGQRSNFRSKYCSLRFQSAKRSKEYIIKYLTQLFFLSIFFPRMDFYYFFQLKTMVATLHQMIGQLDEYFPKAQEFIPERWIKGDPQES